MAQYLFKLGGTTATAWQLKGVAIASYTLATLGQNSPLILFYTLSDRFISSGDLQHSLVFEARQPHWRHKAVDLGLVCPLQYIYGGIWTDFFSVAITGLVVLGGHTPVKDPTANFRDAFAGSSAASAYGATNAIYKVYFAYAGYENAFNVVNEVKVR